MKSIVVVAYYHLIHAVALALTFDEKPNLYVSVDYTKMDDRVIENLRGCGVFNSVVKMDTREFIPSFVREINRTTNYSEDEIKEIGASIFDEHIDSYFYPLFSGADFDEEIYIYTEYHLSMYSIAKHFKHIVLCEDGYKVMKKRLDTFKLKGYFQQLPPFIKHGYYPRMEFRCEKIEKLICSGDYEGLPTELRNKVEVWDIRDIIDVNREAYEDAIKSIFPIEGISFDGNTSLIIEQPLYRTHFCTNTEYYLFYRKLIDEVAKESTVAFKPHPAGRKALDIFERDGVRIIPNWVPVEALNYYGIEFDRAITFYSAAIDLIENAKEHVALCDQNKNKDSMIKKYIDSYIDGEYLNVGLYFYLDRIDGDEYRELRQYFKRNKKYAFHITLICPESAEKKARQIAEKVREEHVEIVVIDHLDQDDIFRSMQKDADKYDYSIVIGENNRAKDVKRIIKKMCNSEMGQCIGIHQRCNNTATICTPLEDHLLTGCFNVLFSRKIMKDLKAEGITDLTGAIEHIYRNRVSTDNIVGESLRSPFICKEDIKSIAERSTDEHVSSMLSSYHDLLDFTYEGRVKGEHMVESELAAYANGLPEKDREVFINVMVNAYRAEHLLRHTAVRRLNRYTRDGFVSLYWEIKRIVEKILRKVMKK